MPTLVDASEVLDIEAVTCQVCTASSLLFIKHLYKTLIRQRQIGGG